MWHVNLAEGDFPNDWQLRLCQCADVPATASSGSVGIVRKGIFGRLTSGEVVKTYVVDTVVRAITGEILYLFREPRAPSLIRNMLRSAARAARGHYQ